MKPRRTMCIRSIPALVVVRSVLPASTSPITPAPAIFISPSPRSMKITPTPSPRTLTSPGTARTAFSLPTAAESGGFSLFLKDGKPTYTYNYFQRLITTIASPDALPPGPAKIVLQFDYDGGGIGKGALVTLYVNDHNVAEARIYHTVPTGPSLRRHIQRRRRQRLTRRRLPKPVHLHRNH